jgi:hypothetical protein
MRDDRALLAAQLLPLIGDRKPRDQVDSLFQRYVWIPGKMADRGEQSAQMAHLALGLLRVPNNFAAIRERAK